MYLFSYDYEITCDMLVMYSASDDNNMCVEYVDGMSVDVISDI